MTRIPRTMALLALMVSLGCANTQDEVAQGTGGDGDGDGDGTGDGDGDGDGTGDGDGDGDGTDTEAPYYDVGAPDMPDEEVCDATDLDQIAAGDLPPCSESSPPDSFDPVAEWHYPADGEPSLSSQVTPLVINFTDDNDDGSIDLCDTPDVILTAWDGDSTCGLHIIDGDFGETGIVHAVLDDVAISCDSTPAVGDIDGDGEPEIVMVTTDEAQTLVAFDNDGSVLWTSDENPDPPPIGVWTEGQVGLYDIDGDGTFEISARNTLYAADGSLLWSMPEVEEAPVGWPFSMYNELIVPTAADLDGDGDLELLTGYSAHDFDENWNATTLWDLRDDGLLPAFAIPHVANFDADPEPEILFTADNGYFVAEHDGTPKWAAAVEPAVLDPLCEDFVWNGFMRPAAIADYDNDGEAEFAVAACDTFAIFDVTETGPVLVMQKQVFDYTGASSTSAFDFLGDATPEAVYSDEHNAWAWSFIDDAWEVRLELPRSSFTLVEFPSIADVDDDGSAEILVASRSQEPALVVFGDADSRWIQARRIFNQHAYWVTHVEEDGGVPEISLPNWEHFNTFRVNSQIEDGSLCDPEG